MYVYVCISMYMYVYVYICMYMYVCMFMYFVHIYGIVDICIRNEEGGNSIVILSPLEFYFWYYM